MAFSILTNRKATGTLTDTVLVVTFLFGAYDETPTDFGKLWLTINLTTGLS